LAPIINIFFIRFYIIDVIDYFYKNKK